MNSSKRQPLSPFIGNMKVLEKIFPPYICSSKPYTKFSSRANFPVIVSYLQSNSPLALFQAYLMRTVLGVYTRTFWFGSVRDLLSRWTSSGTASGSVWNGSISSRVNTRPIRTILVRFHMEPFPCKRGLNVKRCRQRVTVIMGKKGQFLMIKCIFEHQVEC